MSERILVPVFSIDKEPIITEEQKKRFAKVRRMLVRNTERDRKLEQREQLDRMVGIAIEMAGGVK